MLFSFSTPVWFYAKPVDFRKQINGLVIIVADHLKRNPVSSQLFVFRCKSEKKLKMLWWYRNAFWLCHVRMESGRLQFPRIVDDVMELTREQLGWLLSGLNFMEHHQFDEVRASNFY